MIEPKRSIESEVVPDIEGEQELVPREIRNPTGPTQDFYVTALTGYDASDKIKSLKDLLPPSRVSVPTVLMFVTKADGNWAKLAEFFGNGSALRRAVVFLGEPDEKAKKDLENVRLKIPVAIRGRPTYKICDEDSVTIVMWPKLGKVLEWGLTQQELNDEEKVKRTLDALSDFQAGLVENVRKILEERIR